MGRRLGLIIGVNSYQDTAFRPLQFAETDARALAQWLVNTQGGNWLPSDVQLVQGAYATCELVETLIAQLCINVAGPEDIVIVYFAGHAFLNDTTGEGYLALANTRMEQTATGLHLLTLTQKTMARSRAAHVVFMLDCFQTGQLWSARRSSPYDSKPLLGLTLLNALQQTANRMFFCSCRGNELASEGGEKNLGILAHGLIVGLCGQAKDVMTGQVTLQRLHSYLFSSLDAQHRPQLFGQEQYPLVLIGDVPSYSAPQSNGRVTRDLSTGAARPTSPQRVTTSSVMTEATYSATATLQRSPKSTAQLPSVTEQQCAMLLRQARHLLLMQNPGEAYNVVMQILQLAPTNIAALILKGQLLGTVGRYQEAMYVVEQVLYLDANNALVWSMRAALLTNMGLYQQALQAVEHSLELDPNNPETYSIKTSIMNQIAAFQGQRLADAPQKRGGPISFFISTGLLFLGLFVGVIGAALPLFQPNLINVAFGLQSLGLALLCVNATRGSYLYGVGRFILTILGSLLALAILGALYTFGKTRLVTMVHANPKLLIPLLFLCLWLAVAATLPLVLSLGGMISGLVVRARTKKRQKRP